MPLGLAAPLLGRHELRESGRLARRGVRRRDALDEDKVVLRGAGEVSIRSRQVGVSAGVEADIVGRHGPLALQSQQGLQGVRQPPRDCRESCRRSGVRRRAALHAAGVGRGGATRSAVEARGRRRSGVGSLIVVVGLVDVAHRDHLNLQPHSLSVEIAHQGHVVPLGLAAAPRAGAVPLGLAAPLPGRHERESGHLARRGVRRRDALDEDRVVIRGAGDDRAHQALLLHLVLLREDARSDELTVQGEHVNDPLALGTVPPVDLLDARGDELSVLGKHLRDPLALVPSDPETRRQRLLHIGGHRVAGAAEAA